MWIPGWFYALVPYIYGVFAIVMFSIAENAFSFIIGFISAIGCLAVKGMRLAKGVHTHG